MPIAAFVPAIIAAGASVGSAAMQSRAAGRASDRQSAAAQEALDFERKQYEDEQARLKPYRDMGSQAYQRMGRMLGLEPGAQTAPNQPSQTFSFVPPRGGVSAGRNPAQNRSGSPPRIGQRKTFPNGRIGEWDGRGWMAVS